MGPNRQTGGFEEDSEASDPQARCTVCIVFFPRFLNNKGNLKRGCCASGCGGGGGGGGVGVQRQVQAAGD